MTIISTLLVAFLYNCHNLEYEFKRGVIFFQVETPKRKCVSNPSHFSGDDFLQCSENSWLQLSSIEVQP